MYIGISFPCLSFDILYYWKIECLVKPNFHFRTCVYNTFIYFPKRTNRMSNTSTVNFKKKHQVTFLGVNYHRFLKKWNLSLKHIERIYDIQTYIVFFFNLFQRTRTMTKCLRRETTRIPLNWTFLRTCRPHFRNTTGWVTWFTTVMWR